MSPTQTFPDGRRPCYIYHLPIMVLGSLGTAQAQTVGQLMVWRFVQALGASPGISVGAGVIGDIYKLEERGTPYGTYFGVSRFTTQLSDVRRLMLIRLGFSVSLSRQQSLVGLYLHQIPWLFEHLSQVSPHTIGHGGPYIIHLLLLDAALLFVYFYFSPKLVIPILEVLTSITPRENHFRSGDRLSWIRYLSCWCSAVRSSYL